MTTAETADPTGARAPQPRRDMLHRFSDTLPHRAEA
jgi:hypothetical protein